MLQSGWYRTSGLSLSGRHTTGRSHCGRIPSQIRYDRMLPPLGATGQSHCRTIARWAGRDGKLPSRRVTGSSHGRQIPGRCAADPSAISPLCNRAVTSQTESHIPSPINARPDRQGTALAYGERVPNHCGITRNKTTFSRTTTQPARCSRRLICWLLANPPFPRFWKELWLVS